MSEVLSVQQKEGKLRSKPSFLGKIIQKLSYGTQVKVESQKDAWINVSVSGVNGWMHKTALTEKKIVLKAGTEKVDSKVSDDELVLAGKGFSEEVERSHRKKNPNLDYTPVNNMETLRVRLDTLEKFVKDGGLSDV